MSNDNPYLNSDRLNRDDSIMDEVRLKDLLTHLNVVRSMLKNDLMQGRRCVGGGTRGVMQDIVRIIDDDSERYNAPEVRAKVVQMKDAAERLRKAPISTEMYERAVANLERDYLADCLAWCRDADRACRDEIIGGKS